MTQGLGRETIIEFRVSGLFGQVNAIDVASGIEVSVTVPVQASKMDREALAMRKLARALKENGDDPSGAPPPKKSGLIV